MYNFEMADYRFYHPIQIRYGDIDAQGHVNNAIFVTYIEIARFQYLLTLGLWDGKDFLDLGLIVADTHISYLAPLLLTDRIKVGVRVVKMGNKSLVFEYQVEDEQQELIYAKAEMVMVSFDYRKKSTVVIPPAWRKRIESFERGES